MPIKPYVQIMKYHIAEPRSEEESPNRRKVARLKEAEKKFRGGMKSQRQVEVLAA